MTDAQPSFSHATVAGHRSADPEFDHRYRELARDAHQLQRQAGYGNANLKRGLTRKLPGDTDARRKSSVRN